MNPYANYLRKAATELRSDSAMYSPNAIANTCEDAAEEIDRLQRREGELEAETNRLCHVTEVRQASDRIVEEIMEVIVRNTK